MLHGSSLNFTDVRNWINVWLLQRTLISMLFLHLFQPVFSQEQVGMRMGNYSGSWSMAINPANSAYFSGKWDIGIGSFGFFGDNDILYLIETSVQKASLHGKKIRLFSNEKNAIEAEKGSIIGIYNVGKISNFGQLLARVDGPSFLYKVNQNYTFGLSSSTRVNIGFQNLPRDLSSSQFDDFASIMSQSLPQLKGSAMVWSEIAPNVSYHSTGDYDFSIGLTPKLLIGHESAYLKSEDLAIKLGMDSSLYYAGNLNFGLTHANLTSQEVGLKVSGWGSGLDVGFAFGAQEFTKSEVPKYKWRAGFAMLDLGFIFYHKKASKYELPLDESQRAGSIENGEPKTVNSLTTFKERFINDTVQMDGYTIFTPAALSAHFDYHIVSDLYMGILMIQKIPLGANALQRPSSLILSSRFERKWYGLGTSVALVNWKKINLGISAKIGFLHIGTENLMALAFGQQRLSSADFYIGIKINDFSFGSNRKERNQTKKVKCPTF